MQDLKDPCHHPVRKTKTKAKLKCMATPTKFHFIIIGKILTWDTSSQDGGVGKHSLPPCTTTAKNYN